jgi:hypothetical protein
MSHDDRELLISHGCVWTRTATNGIVVPFTGDSRPMPKKPPQSASDEEVRALLERYRCPVPFHEVRTRFLGNIATPALAASPIRMVEGLWGGALPEFPSLDAANELIGALVMGLWNRLTRHQERNAPFRLMRPETTATRDGLMALATTRRQELDGFVDGLFGDEEDMDLPTRANRALEALGETRALFAAIAELMADEAKPATAAALGETLRHTREMTKIAEREMHAVVLACTRARRQILASQAIRH